MIGKTKTIFASAILVALAAAWCGRLAWRAHLGLVTLRVRNAPLAEVIHSMESQTRQKILYDNRLKGKVTLNLIDVPLNIALDAVASKTGARWREVNAVGASQPAWTQLEMTLGTGGDLAAVGWTNLAPRFDDAPPTEPSPDEATLPQPPPAAVLRHANNGPKGTRVVTIAADGSKDEWSAQSLVMETRLTSRLSAIPTETSLADAAQAAATVHGEARLYYVVEKSPLGGMALGGRMGPPHLKFREPGGPPEAGGPPPPMEDIGSSIMAEQRQARLKELANSPEEQVEQARQHKSGISQVSTRNIEINK